MASNQIPYTTRDFQAIRTELQNYVRTYYPELIQDFNDASVFSVFLDLNAAVADNLHYHIDRSIQETVLQYAQQKSSVYNIARTYGLKLPGQRPSVSLVDFSITVPAFGDKEDERYLGTLLRGSQVIGAGLVFENVYDVDFFSPYNAQGFPNRLKIPNFNSNGILLNYTCGGIVFAAGQIGYAWSRNYDDHYGRFGNGSRYRRNCCLHCRKLCWC